MVDKEPPPRPPLRWPYDGPIHPCRSPCALVSFLTYAFARPLLNRGHALAMAARRATAAAAAGDNITQPPPPLCGDDFPPNLHPTRPYQQILRAHWDAELRARPARPRFWRAVLHTYAWAPSVFLAVAGGGRIFGALFLGYFVEQLELGTDFYATLLYGCMVLIGTAVTSIGHHTFYFYVWVGTLRLRVAIVGLVYDKATRLSLAALGRATSGKVFNLAAADSTRIQLGLMFLPYFVWGPLEALVVLGLLVREVGWPAAVGWLFFVIAFIPLQLVFSRWFARLQFRAAQAADRRIKLTTEVVTGAACVKAHCWEHALVNLVDSARACEVGVLGQIATLRGLNEGIFFVSTTVVGTMIFLLKTWAAGESLPSKSVMVCLQLLLILQLTCAKFLCMAIMGYSQAFVSMGRIGRFLQCEEVRAVDAGGGNEEEKEEKAGAAEKDNNDGSIVIEYRDAEAAWEGAEDQAEDDGVTGIHNRTVVLSSLKFSLRRGTLAMVVGPVGSGKTSLLMTLLHELPVARGSLRVKPSLRASSAFVGQQPYVQSGTVLENILFGLPHDDARFRRVLRSCALGPDIRGLSNGERTLVGEKGVTLSGGQRARIALARACYARARFVLLDDPLSAVDPHVASALMDDVICASVEEGGLRAPDTTVVLCTHQVQFAPRADLIVVLGADGQMIAAGSYEQVRDLPALRLGTGREEGGTEGENVGAGVGADADAVDGDSTKRQEDAASAATPNTGPESADSASVDAALEVVAENEEDDEEEEARKRARSVSSTTSSSGRGDAKQEERDRQELAEKRQTGVVRWSTYWGYLQAGGGWLVFLPLALCMASGQSVVMFTSYLMTVLAQKSMARAAAASNQTTGTVAPLPDLDFEQTATRLIIFAAVALVVANGRSVFFFRANLEAARSLHRQMIRSVVRAPMRFFDISPVGRIINKFSNDMAFVDDRMPQSAYDFLSIATQLVGTMTMAAYAAPPVLLILLPLVYGFQRLKAFYMDTSREIKRIEAISRSPVLAGLSETLSGLITLRAFPGVLEQQRNTFVERLDANQNHYYAFIVSARWFGFRLDFFNHSFTLFCIVVVLVLLFAVPEVGAELVDPNLVGLAVLYLMQGGDAFQWCVRQAAEVENMMVSVERIRQYVQLAPEKPLESPAKVAKLLADWPKGGAFSVKSLQLRYAQGLPFVLKGISLDIAPRSKCALVGRTGAGKSSLLSALFRLSEPTSGNISIDGQDILSLGLHDARGALSLIPQVPWLFSGTVRHNLDPLNSHTDEEILDALAACQLGETFESLGSQLGEGGAGLSAGERQLVCLARAYLHKDQSAVFVLDEATANVDRATDAIIQRLIREKFRDKTVITVAHRLGTVIDSDQVVVLEAGRVVEAGRPHDLLQNKDGPFSSMVEETGAENAAQLRAAAAAAAAATATEEGQKFKIQYV